MPESPLVELLGLGPEPEPEHALKAGQVYRSWGGGCALILEVLSPFASWGWVKWRWIGGRGSYKVSIGGWEVFAEENLTEQLSAEEVVRCWPDLVSDRGSEPSDV